MNHRQLPALAAFLLGLAIAAPAPAKTVSDLVSPDKRRAVVEQAQKLTHPVEPAPLPAELPQPFNPAGFDQPDPEEVKAAAAAAAVRAAAAPTVAAPTPGTPAAAAPAGDREILENIAAVIRPSGTIKIGDKAARLTFGRKTVQVGGQFTVTNPANGQDYELELVAIEPPTFTLRYHTEEITRPIKSGK